MREAFITKRFEADALALIAQANTILAEYEAQGLVLTLRQLYYQFVARDLFPSNRRYVLVGKKKWVRDDRGTPNAEPNYKWLGKVVSNARLAGLIDWDMMEDRTRKLRKVNTWESPADIVEAVANQYKEDLEGSEVAARSVDRKGRAGRRDRRRLQ